MPVTRRGDSWQAAFACKGRRYRATFASEKEAKKWEAQAKAAAMAGRAVDVPLRRASSKVAKVGLASTVPTLEAYKEAIFRRRWQDKKASDTAETNIRQVIELLGPTRLVSTLTKADEDRVRDFFRSLGRKNGTINRKIAALSTLATEAVEDGHLAKKWKVTLLKEAVGRVRVISKDEEKRMLKWCMAWGFQDLHDYIVVSLNTGFRQAEILKILAKDVGGEYLATHDTKNDTSRDVFVLDQVREVLERRASGLGPNARLFTMPKKRIIAHWDKMADGIGVDRATDKEFVPHCLRHSYCTRMSRVIDLRTVQVLMGHSSSSTTERYAHTDADQKRLAAQRFAAE